MRMPHTSVKYLNRVICNGSVKLELVGTKLVRINFCKRSIVQLAELRISSKTNLKSLYAKRHHTAY